MRDSIVRGIRIETDWVKSPPVTMWRRPIGPGWSSFAVHGDFFYTQEQRGDDEIVACYRLSSGEPVWTHRDAARFWESNGGAGPRATPTLDRGRVYSFGATGILNALDAASGARLVAQRRGGQPDRGPGLGLHRLPLVVGDLVIVAAAGKLRRLRPSRRGRRAGRAGRRRGLQLAAAADDRRRPAGPASRPDAARPASAPADGARLWELTVPSSALAATIVQPALTATATSWSATAGQRHAPRRGAHGRRWRGASKSAGRRTG